MSYKHLRYNKKDIDYINAVNKLLSPYNHNNYAYNNVDYPSKCQVYELHPNKFKKSKKKSGQNKSKKKSGQNKIKKIKGGETDKIRFKKYKIENPGIDDYNNAFGDENGPIYFDTKNSREYLLYKIPITEETDDRIKCARKDVHENDELYRYAYIDNKACKHVWDSGEACELSYLGNIFGNNNTKIDNKILNNSNPYSKTPDLDLIKCVENKKIMRKGKSHRVPSPTSVAEGVFHLEKITDELKALQGGKKIKKRSIKHKRKNKQKTRKYRKR